MIPKNIESEHIMSAIARLRGYIAGSSSLPKGLGNCIPEVGDRIIHFQGRLYMIREVVSLSNKYANVHILESSSYTDSEAEKFLNEKGFPVSIKERKRKPYGTQEKKKSYTRVPLREYNKYIDTMPLEDRMFYGRYGYNPHTKSDRKRLLKQTRKRTPSTSKRTTKKLINQISDVGLRRSRKKGKHRQK